MAAAAVAVTMVAEAAAAAVAAAMGAAAAAAAMVVVGAGAAREVEVATVMPVVVERAVEVRAAAAVRATWEATLKEVAEEAVWEVVMVVHRS